MSALKPADIDPDLPYGMADVARVLPRCKGRGKWSVDALGRKARTGKIPAFKCRIGNPRGYWAMWGRDVLRMLGIGPKSVIPETKTQREARHRANLKRIAAIRPKKREG